MKKKIYINRPEMSSNHIAAHKDFGALQQGFQPPSGGGGGASSGFFTKTVYLATGIVITTVALTIWYFTGNKDANELATQTITQTTEILGGDTTQTNDTSVIVAPLSGIDIPYSEYTVQADMGKILTYPTGTQIIIPGNAFVNRAGQVVTGEVEVRYREFHDPVAFFAAGIPMGYDSAKVNYHFESAGMMEIAAYQGRQRLYTNPNAPITMEMRSYNASAAYNIYSLNEGTGEWRLKGKDVISGGELINGTSAPAAWDNPSNVNPVPVLQKELKQIQKEIVEIKQTEPTKPEKADPKKNRFDVDVRPEEFPEAAVYKGVFFEVSDLNKEFKDEWYTITWEDMSLRRLEDSVNYELTFIKGNQQVKIIVHPVLEGKSFADAKKQFDQKYATYQTTLKQKQAEEKRKQEEIVARQKQYEKEVIARQTEASIVRTFQIDQFGFWNSDSPQMLPTGALVSAEFVDEAGKELNFPHVYLVEVGRNILYTYWNKTFDRFQYNPAKQNLVWGMTRDGNLAVMKPNQLLKQQGKLKFEMEVITELPKTLDELKQVIGYKGKLAS